MLARKDFIAVTRGIRTHMNADNPHLSVQAVRIAMAVSNRLAAANPTSFNRNAFLIACGVLKEPMPPTLEVEP